MTALYEKLRRERTDKIREETFKQQEEHHLSDGDVQEARDKHLARSFTVQDDWLGSMLPPAEDVADQRQMGRTHPRIQPWLFGYDAYDEADKMWDSQVPSEAKGLDGGNQELKI